MLLLVWLVGSAAVSTSNSSSSTSDKDSNGPKDIAGMFVSLAQRYVPADNVLMIYVCLQVT